MYNKLVESYFFDSMHGGVLEGGQRNPVHVRHGQMGRGDVLDFYLCVDAENTVIAARFKAYGSPYLIAAAEWVCRQLEGSKICDHPCFDYRQLIDLFSIPDRYYAVAIRVDDAYQQLVATMKARGV